MELLEEYLARHAMKRMKQPVARYNDKSQLLLISKSDKATYKWLHLDIDLKEKQNEPPKFYYRIASNPTLYSTPDFSHTSYQYEKVVTDGYWEWEQYEKNILDLCKAYSTDYSAVTLELAIPICWKMFVTNNDRWLANSLPIKMIEHLHDSICGEDQSKSIMAIEGWMRERHERIFSSWQAVKKNFDVNNYASWLAEIINN